VPDDIVSKVDYDFNVAFIALRTHRVVLSGVGSSCSHGMPPPARGSRSHLDDVGREWAESRKTAAT